MRIVASAALHFGVFSVSSFGMLYLNATPTPDLRSTTAIRADERLAGAGGQTKSGIPDAT
jgi:hypothetical protein